MRYLIDTHVLVWWWDEVDRLSAAATEVLRNRNNHVLVSAVSGWEIATKVRQGKLPAMADRVEHYVEHIAEDGFDHLLMRPEHGVRGGLLEGRHKDPFDRVIAAQALIEGLTIVTRDREFAAFGCKVLW